MCENFNKKFPFEIKDVETELNDELLSKFKGERTGFVRVGPKGYFFPKRYEREAALYHSMPLRPSDVFVITYPRSGTTWTQEMVWLIANDFDYKKAADVFLTERFPSIDLSMVFHPEVINDIIEEYKGNETVQNAMKAVSTPATEKLKDAASPRFIKTHLPLSLLPPTLLQTARVVYVARDPRDVAVSFYHLCRLTKPMKYDGDFKTFWNYFFRDLIYYAPYFECIKESWEKRHDPNVLFLFYEEIAKNMPNTIRKVANFFEKSVTDEQVAKLTDHLRIENFRKNKSVNDDGLKNMGIFASGEQPFIRKGKVGGWRDYFDEEMTQQAERWIADNLRGTDLRFPSVEDQ